LFYLLLSNPFHLTYFCKLHHQCIRHTRIAPVDVGDFVGEEWIFKAIEMSVRILHVYDDLFGECSRKVDIVTAKT
jgi:hypothetical protein